MTAPADKLMDGRALARQIRDTTHAGVQRLRDVGVIPTLATVLVGNDPASATYVRMKARRCEEVGMRSIGVQLPATCTTAEVIARIRSLADDPAVHGILVQHPVPAPLDRRAVFEAIPPDKDVDGVTSTMLGRVILGMPSFCPCTPRGIMALLSRYHVQLDGVEAMVVGRSPILGRPLASLLINAHATVTLCHSRTRDLPSILRWADVLIAAVGRPRFVQADWIKEGAVVIDAGYNPGNIGDVDFDAVLPKVRLITPVPGGVGPATIAMLLDQTLTAAARQTHHTDLLPPTADHPAAH